MSNNDEIKILVVDSLSDSQIQDVEELQKITFDVGDEEADEDFYQPKIVQILAYIDDKLVGWAGVHIVEQKYNGKKIKFGGYGIGTHPDWQRKGIASKVAQKAMQFLKDKGCDIGFLSVDPENKGSIKLHQKNGFVFMKQNISWTNSRGEIKQDIGGMITPINSRELFNFVLSGTNPFYVGHGYW